MAEATAGDPTVSIVLPVHNAAKHLASALSSLRALVGIQRAQLVVVNDHSEDDSLRLLSTWPEHFADIVILESESRGVSAARNQAVASCTGDYIWFTDADDAWDPEILSTLLASARKTDADLVICNARKILPDGTPGPEIRDAVRFEVINGIEALRRVFIGDVQGHLWNKLFRRETLGMSPFPATRAHSDMGGILRLLPNVENVSCVPVDLYSYFLNSGSILNGKNYRWEDLTDCLAIAESALIGSAETKEMRRSLVLFKYRQVLVPLTHEYVRRSQSLDADARRARSKTIRALIRFGELPVVFRSGDVKSGAEALLAKLAPTLFARLYSAWRSREWSALDR